LPLRGSSGSSKDYGIYRDRPSHAVEKSSRIHLAFAEPVFRIPPLRDHFCPAFGCEIKINVFKFFPVQFQYFGDRDPYPLHEQIQGTGFKDYWNIVIFRDPYPRLSNGTDLETIASVLDCTVTYTAPVFKMNDTGEEI
jgi:hypothetical protein